MRQKLINQWSLIIIFTMTLVTMGYGQDATSSGNVRQAEESIKSGARQWRKKSSKTPGAGNLSSKDLLKKKMGKDYRDNSKRYQINNVKVQGDLDFFVSLGSNKIPGESLHYELLNEVTGKKITLNEIKDLCYQYTQEFVNRDYLLAYIEAVPKDYSDGVLILQVHSADFGLVRFFQKGSTDPETGKPLQYTGKYYDVAQIRNRIKFKEFDAFNYKTFQENLSRINTHPDITLDSKLHVITDSGTRDRKVDIDFLVTENSPFHAAFRVDNLGTKDTDDWRARATVQYLNLTQRYDVLTLDVSSSIGDSVYSGAASYHYPLKGWTRGSLTVYAGASALDADDLDIGIDSEGEGWFAGWQLSKGLITNDAHQLDLTFGWVHRQTEDDLFDASQNIIQTRSISMSPFTVGFKYANPRNDSWGGRNFLSFNYSFNLENWLGSDDENDFAKFRVNSDGNYGISRIQVARIQRLFGPDGKWVLFLKADGQVAEDALVSPEQKAIGGMNSVRGYEEREILGDEGVSGTIELRTPLLDRTFFNASKIKGDESFQLVAFSDMAYVRRHDSLPGEIESQNMASIGAGLRFNWSSHMQLRFDYGFPLATTDETITSRNGRGHVVLQVQY